MEGISRKNEKKAKNGFPNVALEGVDKRRPNLVSKRERTVEKKERREEEEEEEKKKKKKRRRRGEEEEPRSRGMELHGILKFCMNFHALMVNSLFPKPRVLLGFFLTLEFLKVILVKP